MNSRNDFTYWEDIIGCILLIVLMCLNYSTLVAEGGGPRGGFLVNVFIILNKYLGEVGVYLLLEILFLWFFVSVIRKIRKINNYDK